jgi:RNA polymerase sigma factor (sigma-70 family)
VAQDVFVRVGRRLQRRAGLSVGRHYIERAARNRALDQFKRDQRRAAIIARLASESSPIDSTPDVVERMERYQLLLSSIHRLPKRCRKVVLLAVRTGWSQSRIARELGITTKAVAKQYARARRIAWKLLRDPAFCRTVVESSARVNQSLVECGLTDSDPSEPTPRGGRRRSRSLV